MPNVNEEILFELKNIKKLLMKMTDNKKPEKNMLFVLAVLVVKKSNNVRN